jgi:hypothetical protein
MQLRGATSHPVCEDLTLTVTRVEYFRIHTKWQPLEAPLGKTSFQLIMSFAKCHETWVEPLSHSQQTDFWDCRTPGIYHER